LSSSALWMMSHNNNNNKQHRYSSKPHWTIGRYRGGAAAAAALPQYSTTALASTAATATDTETKQQPVEIFRKDYKPPPYTISTVQLDFDIHPGKTTVKTKLTLTPNPIVADTAQKEPLVLDGDETSVTLRQIQLNGRTLVENVDYKLEPGKLVMLLSHDAMLNNQHQMVLDMVADLVPEDNTQLSGLYYSEPMYCTQCEAQGFRRITYYLDRPDVMAVFERVRLEADAEAYPVLLSNGSE
jgi:aminopeptidase N